MPIAPPLFDGVSQLVQPRVDTATDQLKIQDTVAKITAFVRKSGDVAVSKFTAKFDKCDVTSCEVSSEALNALDPQTKEDSEFAIANVGKFAEAQIATMLVLETEFLQGVDFGHRIIPRQSGQLLCARRPGSLFVFGDYDDCSGQSC